MTADTQLAEEFKLRLEASLSAVVTRPNTFAIRFRDVRLCQLRQFPYGVFFYLSGDLVRVIAVMHLRRDQRSWQRRR